MSRKPTLDPNILAQHYGFSEEPTRIEPVETHSPAPVVHQIHPEYRPISRHSRSSHETNLLWRITKPLALGAVAVAAIWGISKYGFHEHAPWDHKNTPTHSSGK
ncbi:MAG TPA: hypothetical protein VFB03_03125 [Candidatus Saccharimonadales bacterium]|nr:hypothetical protein [Candidatus Saccharimonadales bacterium]